MPDCDDRKRSILEVAERLFNRLGYENTSMRQIAEEAGSGKASLYYYFKSKEEIFLKVLQKEGSELLAKFHETSKGDISYQEKLINYLKIPLEIFQKHSSLMMSLFFRHHDHHINKSKNIMSTTKDMYWNKFRELIEEGIAGGFIRKDIDVERLSKVYIFNLIGTLFIRIPGEPEAESMEEKKLNYEFMLEIMLKGITV